MDGLLEGTIFAYVILLVLIDPKHWFINDPDLNPQAWARQQALSFSAMFSVVTTAFALMDVDFRTSVVIQRNLSRSALIQLRHIAFRGFEVVLRCINVVMMVFCIRVHFGSPWGGYIIIATDYVFGVVLLIAVGWRDPMRKASFILGVPLVIANVVQFTDVPVMAYQARRISSILVPARAVYLAIVLIGCCLYAKNGIEGYAEERLITFLFQRHPEMLVVWALAFTVYYTLLGVYACRTRPVADVYTAVANGDVATLRNLLGSNGAILDANRCGPDGRSPLHVAVLQERLECCRLLMQEFPNAIHAKTADGHSNTILHLAAVQREAHIVHMLCTECETSMMSTLVNTQNARGDTPLHIATRSLNVDVLRELLALPDVDLRVRNKQGATPSESVMSQRFGFDYRSVEHEITMLFHDAEIGVASMTSTGVSMQNLPMQAIPAPSQNPTSDSQQTNLVPLISVDHQEETALIKKFGASEPTSMESVSTLPPHAGVSSFMLSSGLGALSRVFLNIIREEDCTDVVNSEASSETVSVNDFQLLQTLGKGSFGKVELVQHKATKVKYAMKLLERQKYTAQRITRFAYSEQYILKTTRHPLIVSLNFAFQTSRFWVMVMEYCPGGDLMERLIKRGVPGLPLKVCARSGGEILLALEHLHRVQVIFRDLKPENVIFDAEGRSKLTDFGLAKKVGGDVIAMTACGTEGYAAPELLARVGYTYAVDLYSFGVTLYMVFTGGQASQRDPSKRVPPHNHVTLKNKIKNATNIRGDQSWTTEASGALDLLSKLITPADKRLSATEAKLHPFFVKNLGHLVDDLMPLPAFGASSSLTKE
eukprot:CAMPEP_0169150270 /NCGR_PEP_ID=MMETSP1015-20121227/50075_1 /TAXON_ID=342587 /ORGANISM="Karlodinium micrum, Strain CCMP2283" /LENGTH=824 /DNA_ID=CAMNT_0009219355 /DNA_START=482 /DNA_END=2954 /DNA_ORIENTATION=-